MGLKEKIEHAEISTWLTEGFTPEEVAEIKKLAMKMCEIPEKYIEKCGGQYEEGDQCFTE